MFEPNMILTPKSVWGRDFGVDFLIDKCCDAFPVLWNKILIYRQYYILNDQMFFCKILLSRGLQSLSSIPIKSIIFHNFFMASCKNLATVKGAIHVI